MQLRRTWIGVEWENFVVGKREGKLQILSLCRVIGLGQKGMQ
jgi:hypothetical protein